MAVIESLQRKTEENGDPVEDLSEEADGSEENPCLTSGANDSEKIGVCNDLEDPSIKCKPQRANKRKKVDSGDCLLNKDEEENKISAEKPDDRNGDNEAGKLESEISEGSSENLLEDRQLPAVKRSSKRKNTDGGAQSSKLGVGVKTRSRRVQEAAADGNDSPSSPFHVPSSDDDFE